MALIDDIRLSLVGLRHSDKIYLLEHFGSAEAIFAASDEVLCTQAELNEKALAKLHEPSCLERAQNELQFIERYKIRTLAYDSSQFPYRVASTPDSPSMLFVKGDIDFTDSGKWIAVVGTRKVSDEGKINTRTLIEDIAREFPSAVIVSGLAFGVDIAAHRAALDCGLRCVAVVAHGLDTLYPSVHRQWAKEIIEKGGAIVTEFCSGTPSLPPYFVQRNRIIASLSDAVFVVESAGKGGSMTTADIANSYDRELFAFAGRNSDKNYVGCNRLIKNHKASLYQDISDLKYIMGWESENANFDLTLSLNSLESKIYRAMGNEPISAEQIVELVDEPIYKVFSALSAMEVNEIIKSVKARMYIKLK